eukprot:364448-Chlamydomonas_euryale.AAC.5
MEEWISPSGRERPAGLPSNRSSLIRDFGLTKWRLPGLDRACAHIHVDAPKPSGPRARRPLSTPPPCRPRLPPRPRPPRRGGKGGGAVYVPSVCWFPTNKSLEGPH